MINAVQLLTKLRGSLSIRTAVALAAGALAAIVFLEIAEEVLEGAATSVDRPISLWVHGFDSPALDQAMRAFTFLGSLPAIIVGVALVAGWALLRKERALAGVLVAVASATEALNVLLKLLFQRPRPELFFEVALPLSHSFPSGHAMVSTAVYGMAAFVAGRIAQNSVYVNISNT